MRRRGYEGNRRQGVRRCRRDFVAGRGRIHRVLRGNRQGGGSAPPDRFAGEVRRDRKAFVRDGGRGDQRQGRCQRDEDRAALRGRHREAGRRAFGGREADLAGKSARHHGRLLQLRHRGGGARGPAVQGAVRHLHRVGGRRHREGVRLRIPCQPPGQRVPERGEVLPPGGRQGRKDRRAPVRKQRVRPVQLEILRGGRQGSSA